MDVKNPPRVSRTNNGPTTITKGGGSRFATTTVDDGGGDPPIECSGKFCRSCTAGLIADCVALCCCPCAVVHCFALAFVKAPWVVGRRCLGLGSKKKVKHKKKCKRGSEDFDGGGVVLERNYREGNLMRVASSNNANNVVNVGGVGEMESVTVNAGFEAEKVWLELYQIGHLDFGRVSFSDQ